MLKVENKDKQTSSEEYYWHYKDDKGVDYLFSSNQLITAKERAIRNKEDLPLLPDQSKFKLGLAVGAIGGGFVCTLVYFLVQNFLIK
jgi:hypothetical protein